MALWISFRPLPVYMPPTDQSSAILSRPFLQVEAGVVGIHGAGEGESRVVDDRPPPCVPSPLAQLNQSQKHAFGNSSFGVVQLVVNLLRLSRQRSAEGQRPDEQPEEAKPAKKAAAKKATKKTAKKTTKAAAKK